MVTTRQLTPDDLGPALDLIKECPEPPSTPETWERMRFIMTQWYLVGRTHRLHGSFEGDRLVATCGMRLDLPIEGAWSMTNLRTRGDGVGLGESLSATLLDASQMGLTAYYTCMTRKRVPIYHRLFKRLSPELYGPYEHEIVCEIPMGTRPESDLWWGMMGRRLAADYDVVIKAARLGSDCLAR